MKHQLKGEDLFLPHLKIYVNRGIEAFRMPKHSHDFIEINYVKEGHGYHYIEDDVIPVKKGDLFILPIGTSHVFRPSSYELSNTLIVINCVFLPEAVSEQLTFLPQNTNLHHCLHEPSKLKKPWFYYEDRSSKLLDLFDTLLVERKLRGPGYEALLTSLLVQLLVYLYRTELPEDYEQRTPNKIKEIIQFMKANYAEKITVQSAADLVYLSPSHVQRLFREATGRTFTQYLQNIRIEKSCELLQNTMMSVQEVANQVGYQDLKFFHALFRKKTGLTPREYRKRSQMKQETNLH